jgi:hypothetical protein
VIELLTLSILAASRDPFLLNELRFLFFGLLSCTLVLAKAAAAAAGARLLGSRLRLPPARGSLGGTLLGISSFCLWHFAPTLPHRPR